MNKLSEIFTKLTDKWKSTSIGKKILFGTIISVVLALIIIYVSYSNANKYGVLFSDLTSEDGNTISTKLDELKVDKYIKGNTIYVPKEQVDELRLQLAGEISGGSKGYELLDSGNSFGMTDEEFNLKKLRATQGELERTIKSFPQIENARVHITPAEESVFIKDEKPAKAAVYIQLKAGTKLSSENIRSIMALVSGSVENLPKENIEVIDDKMNLLSKGVLEEEEEDFTTSVDKQQAMEREFEKKLENALMDMLVPAIGRNKVNVKVYSDLDFDAKENTVITYDPNKVEVSSQIIRENSSSEEGTNSASPVDNNMGNTTPVNGGTNTTTKEDITTNYKVGETTSKVISAPGEVKRITASVIIDGKLDEATKADLERLVSGVIGFKEDRGDSISIVGMTFDPSANEEEAKAIAELKEATERERRYQLYKTLAVAGVSLVAFTIAMIFMFKVMRKKKDEPQSTLDVVIGGNIPVKEAVKFDPIDLEVENEKTHLEQEIKKYATNKPDQVADIVRSWLAEDER
ncbi:flagellar basal-body MS-ring/collar protein FliF [Clostridium thermarum]|uniref:flagellar basal-body MS-ring/collar protein FliF n=1 Tax=Clostridium thermarum TaxID=1716543 RepID=UPI0013D32732|nr:flagellar basal-body MS-ring/collar protein FliF [Clostridium thermarum]